MFNEIEEVATELCERFDADEMQRLIDVLTMLRRAVLAVERRLLKTAESEKWPTDVTPSAVEDDQVASTTTKRPRVKTTKPSATTESDDDDF